MAIFGQKTLILALFGPFLTLFNAKKTSFSAILGKKFPEKLSGLSVKGGGVPPLSAKGFLAKWLSVKGVGGGTPLMDKIR